MDLSLGAGLGLLGSIINDSIETTKFREKKNIPKVIRLNPPAYLTNFNSNIVNDSRGLLYNSISDYYQDSENPNSKIVNNIWRIENDTINQIKNKEINNLLNKDINMIKNIEYNNIETMKNIKHDFDSNESDSVFSDNFSLPKYKTPNKSNNNYKVNKRTLNDNISGSSNGSSYDSDESNVNLRVLNTQNKFLSDVISNLSGKSDGLDKSIDKSCNNSEKDPDSFSRQYDELKFDHQGIPGTMQNSRQVLNLFNNKMLYAPQSNFNGKEDGRYGVTSDMTHNNMEPYFKSRTYGYNPEFEKEQTNYSVRKVELFSGSDQALQFKHKSEVKALFSPETNKVDSVTGVPNFSDFFESRVIPSDKRQNEKPFQPVRVTPGLNLGYNEMGNNGFQDLYRVLPKNVDQLRTVDRPKVSYQTPVVQGQKGDRRGAIGEFIQKGPDRFYEQDPSSFMPQVGDFIAPAIYGKHLKTQTNRSLKPDNIHLNPAKTDVDYSTPEYLQGQFKKTFKRTFDHDGPRNVQYDTRGQIINQQTYMAKETARQDTNWGDKWIGNGGNMHGDYLANYENFTPNATQRETMPELDKTNIKGNFISVPLANYANFVPETTLREIMLDDNGRKNLTNVSNSVKSYLFNAVNAIPDETLRSILTEKVILTNVKENSERGYLFNNDNAIQDPNMRNLSENNLILGALSNKEQGYLFNNINAIPDPTLRNLVNTLYQRGGLGFQGDHQEQYAFNYENGTPQTNMRNLTQDQKYIVGAKGNHQNEYVFNYENGVPQTNLRNLTQDQKYIVGTQGNHQEQYAFNYENGTPQTNLRNLTQDQKYIIGTQGNHQEQYVFNYENGTPQTNLRNLTQDQKYIVGARGNHQEQYAFNYENGTPDTNLRNLTQDQKYIIGTKGNHQSEYAFNYENGSPDATLRDLSSPQKNIIGTKGNMVQQVGFDYENGVPDTTLRELSANQKNIIGTQGNKFEQYNFNFENGVPDETMREFTGPQKNLIGSKGNFSRQIGFNYDDVPDITMRNLSENTKNIVGTVGDGTQSRSRLDVHNALLNTEKEVIAQRRDPVPVKDNRGPTTQFTEYVFCDDSYTPQKLYSGYRPLEVVKNDLYSFTGY